MQTSNYNILLYIFVGIVVSLSIYLSRLSGEGESNFFNGGKSSMWIVLVLSMIAGSLVQFWILLVPILSLSRSAILVILSLFVSIMLPVMVIKNRQNIVSQFMNVVPAKLKSVLFVVVIIFFVIIQPFALLYLGEKIIAQLMGGSYHFLLVFLISAAGLSTVIGGRKVVVYANAMFGVAVIASTFAVIYLGGSFSAPMMFLQMLFAEGAQYFQRHNVFETNWIFGFIGFSVITWWMWWIDNGAFHFQGKQSDRKHSSAAMFASFPLIVIALVVLPAQSGGGTALLNEPASAMVLANNELLVFFFIFGVVAVMFSAFSLSFHSVAAITANQIFHGNIQQNVEEKHILIARLVIVLSALLTILYIPFAQYFGPVTLLLYVQYLACFAASMVGAFTVFVLRRNFSTNGLTAGVLGGMSAGAVIVLLTYSGTEMLTPLLKTPYGAATGIFFFSMLCSVGGSVMTEWKVAKSSAAV